MKQVLTPEDLNILEQTLKDVSGETWVVLEKEGVDSVWVSNLNGSAVALLDYSSCDQNKADALFIASSRNYASLLLTEIKTLRKRVLDLIASNNAEIQKRVDVQGELDEIKEILRNAGKNT